MIQTLKSDRAGGQARVDARLQLDRVGTFVEVKADAISLQTESTGVERRVDSRVIDRWRQRHWRKNS